MTIKTRLEKLEQVRQETKGCPYTEWKLAAILSNYAATQEERDQNLAALGDCPPHPGTPILWDKTEQDIVKAYGHLTTIENVEEADLERTEIEWARINRD